MSRILIIEDETEIADLERDYLELSGFEVETEHQGDVGLKRALTEEFDLFILDLTYCREWMDLRSAGRSGEVKIRRF